MARVEYEIWGIAPGKTEACALITRDPISRNPITSERVALAAKAVCERKGATQVAIRVWDNSEDGLNALGRTFGGNA